jgi:hypothetical protein
MDLALAYSHSIFGVWLGIQCLRCSGLLGTP